MSIVRDWGIFDDAKGRRCIAYNGDCDYCLDVAEDGAQTFTLAAPGERCVVLDGGQSKVRNMAVPYNRNAGSPDRLPVGVPVFFEGTVTIEKTYQRLTAWWFLLAQIQRITNPTSPPVALQIENVAGMEYFRAVVCYPGATGGLKLDTPRVAVPRGTPFTFRIEYTDAAGGPDGRLKVTITPEGGLPRVICAYSGPTGFPGNEGLYAGWGIYGADQWAPKQLPLVLRFEALDWGLAA